MTAVTVIRMVASPVVAMLIIVFLPVNDLLRAVMIIQASMPAAANTTMFALQFGTEPDLVSFHDVCDDDDQHCDDSGDFILIGGMSNCELCVSCRRDIMRDSSVICVDILCEEYMRDCNGYASL